MFFFIGVVWAIMIIGIMGIWDERHGGCPRIKVMDQVLCKYYAYIQQAETETDI
jgi:hypothetical protein